MTALLCAGGAGAEPAPQEVADIRRALTLLNVVGEEYREGVVDGEVVLPVEYDEAKLFLDEAQGRLRGAAPHAAAATETQFAAIRADLNALAPLDPVRARLDALRAEISRRTAVTEEVFPPAPPSAARGQALFMENCVACHGEAADGAGPDAARLDPPPANFTDPDFMRVETPFDFFHIISVGKARSAMPAWGEVLSLQERWDLVAFLWTVQPGRAGLAEGQGVYLSACAGCHGATGDAQGPLSAGLLTPAAPLDHPGALARKSNGDLIEITASGVAGSAMPGFAGRLTEPQMAAAAAYLRLLSLGGEAGLNAPDPVGGAPLRFAGVLRLLGAEYQAALHTAAAPSPQELAEAEILLAQVRRQAPAVQSAIAAADPAGAAQFGERIAALAGAIDARQPPKQVLALTGGLSHEIERRFPPAATGSAGDADALAEAKRLLDGALAAYRDGNPRAVYMVSDAYFLFDPLEQQLSLRDDPLRVRVESRFAELRGVMASPGRTPEAAALVDALAADFEAARAVLAPRPTRYGVAFQSAFIILREGFEVVLVVGALLAYVVKTGHPALRAPILWGAGGGLLASLLTAWALLRLLSASGATAEVLEGVTMLLASVVLFFVSYWLISKAEADRWQRYIHGKVHSAVAAGNVLALAGAAFLAVYREGVETVLFYRALIAAAPADLGSILGGFAAGAAALALVYVAYQRIGRRLPMRQFFTVTGALLYYLAIVFAGKGVAELQAAGWISTTPLAWAPRVELLGIYPTVETLAAQGALVACVLYAVFVTWRRARSERARLLGVPSAGGANAA